ncbi:3-ketodihydrosphingosine reductase [Macrosteles quadrilineatus]|uniref:3-ketodihydrosphingosine reductase n=1 Tax=Macrosteles quadrilineatus TaxID=74068 RepID=UPI0023E1B4A0|nr:3-ketodihydrosphingosine reductase [Macrosteles quadrilineatus]
MEEKVDMFTVFVLSFYGPILTAILVLFVTLLFYFMKFKSALNRTSFSGQHIVVTGGSSGIGKSVAMKAAAKGAHVTIVARNIEKLNAAKEEITSLCTSSEQKISTISLDVSKDPNAIERAFAEAEKQSGPIFMLINCAGQSFCGTIEDLTEEQFKYMMDLNYYGTVFPTKAVVAGMKKRKEGHIVITSSQAGMIGVYGFTAYSPSKFALRGFAEALDMEVRAHGVKVTVCLPPDTDTPGFEEEEKTKPLETKLICQSAGLVSPDVVATHLLNDALAGRFFSTVGFEGFMLVTTCAGMAPVTSLIDLFCQVILMGILRLVSVFYLLSFQKIIKKCMKTKDEDKKSE